MINKETNNDIDRVLVYQDKKIKSINKTVNENTEVLEERIQKSEKILNDLNINIQIDNNPLENNKKSLDIPSWEELVACAKKEINGNVQIEYLFTDEELKQNEEYIKVLNEEFNSLHRLDEYDYMICAIGSLIGAIIDIMLIGIPVSPTRNGIKAGSLANFIRDHIEQRYGTEKIKELANSYKAKVPYDLQHNDINMERMVDIKVEGLCPDYHRLYSLGHDPFVGFFVGIMDIMNGTMTTIDEKGKLVRQVVKYSNLEKRVETDFIEAIIKQINHLKTDIATSMGLPVPLMGLFNFLNLGSIEYKMNGGEGKDTISEIVRQMYKSGFDFIHFCSQSVAVAVMEIFVRVAYAIKRINEGFNIKESVPLLKINRQKYPKIATMLFLSHSGAVAINTGEIIFTKNPLSINYAEWLAFSKYSFNQLKWALYDKPMLRYNYVKGIINKEFDKIFNDIDFYIDKKM